MEIIEFEQDRVIASKNDKVSGWYLIQQGSVVQKTEFSEVKLEKNSIIGFLEKEVYLCDYIALEDTTVVTFTFENSEDIKKVIAGQEKIRNVFLRAALVQRHQLLCLYSEIQGKVILFRSIIINLYNDYKTFCAKYKIPERSFSKMEQFRPLVMKHRAERWEVNNSVSIIKSFAQEYIQLMSRDDNLTVGVIMEAAAQMRRFTQGIFEMENYLLYNKEMLVGESEDDLFKLFMDLSVEMYAKKFELYPVEEKLQLLVETAEKLQLYNSRMLDRRMEEFQNYDYKGVLEEMTTEDGLIVGRTRKEMDITKINCVTHILTYAGYEGEQIDQIAGMIESYYSLSDMLSTDGETYALRRKVAETFYEIYQKVFLQAMQDEDSLTPILEMFLNFGFMDAALLREEQVKELYNMCSHLDICRSKHIYTIYEWLKLVYRGKKETSKNEFDQNYLAYLTELCRNGEITQKQMEKDAHDPGKRVAFEIQNMFVPTNKLTYGKVTTFSPILCENDLINAVESMLVTAEKIELALQEARVIDYSLFYREVSFSDPAKGITSERVMKEVMPDIILLPNVGSRGMMWQETASAKSDTPARFMFPIFTSVDLQDMMLEVLGRYRWEMCRKVEGVYWNDIREKSLTAEYCAYLQFYRKNNELSIVAKEKVKSSLLRAKNNYREVFVKDYVNLLKFESKGSYRLNKVSRDILTRYCPFVKAIRNELRDNPFYQLSITRFETEAAKKLQRYQGLYLKYNKSGGKHCAELRETIAFYEM